MLRSVRANDFRVLGPARLAGILGLAIILGASFAPSSSRADTWDDCMQHKDFPKKLRACTQVIDGKNTDARDRITAQLHRAFGRRMTESYDAAEEDVEAVINASPRWGHAYYERGMLMLVREELYLALRDFDQAVRLMDGKAFVWIERGRTNYLLGNDWAAAQDLGEALRIDPEAARALDYRGRAYCRQDRADSALADWTRQRQVDDRAAEQQRGWVSDFAQDGALSEAQLAAAMDRFAAAGCPGL